MGLEQGRLPNWNAIKMRNGGDDKWIREDRRLFYVGLTRAKQEVHLTCSGWYENSYGSRFNDGVSEFVREVYQSLNPQGNE